MFYAIQIFIGAFFQDFFFGFEISVTTTFCNISVNNGKKWKVLVWRNGEYVDTRGHHSPKSRHKCHPTVSLKGQGHKILFG